MVDFLKSWVLFGREINEFKSFLSADKADIRKLVFYSEHAAYAKFFSPILEKLREISPCSFLTSDPDDPVFSFAPDRIRTFYIKNLLGALLPQLDARAIVMTMPDLEQYHIKRSRKGAEHIYFFHALVSTHMIYRKGAFDHYDTVLCAGPHHEREIRQTEKVYGLKPKKLVSAGYPLLDKIHADYQAYTSAKTVKTSVPPLALIAPSWGPANIMLSCLEPLVRSLKASGFRIIIRPHPEFIKRRPKELAQLRAKPDFAENVEFEIYPRKENSLFEADILVTDWSGIALEYAFGTERPVLFIDTPRKVLNAEYEKVCVEPIEVKLRSEIGFRLSLKMVSQAGERALQLMKGALNFKARIQACREQSVYNFGDSTRVITDYLKGCFK